MKEKIRDLREDMQRRSQPPLDGGSHGGLRGAVESPRAQALASDVISHFDNVPKIAGADWNIQEDNDVLEIRRVAETIGEGNPVTEGAVMALYMAEIRLMQLPKRKT